MFWGGGCLMRAGAAACTARRPCVQWRSWGGMKRVVAVAAGVEAGRIKHVPSTSDLMMQMVSEGVAQASELSATSWTLKPPPC